MKQFQQKPSQGRRKGSMLIVSLEVLALLSIFAVAFALIMTVELEASRNEINKARAQFIAMAGMEAAIAELQEQCRNNFYTSPTDSWVFEPSYKDGCGGLVELENSNNLSYVKTSTRKGFKGSDISRVISGEVGSTYPSGLDYYRLKIWDSASRININGPQESLPLMLENLGAGIALYAKLPNPVPAGKGQQLIEYRRNTGENRFRSLKEIQDVLGEEGASNLSGFITFSSWKDSATKKPLPTDKSFPLSGNIDQSPYTGDSTEARPPVNINTASKPILYALLMGLKGYKTTTVEGGILARGIKPYNFLKDNSTIVEFKDPAKVQKFVDEIFNAIRPGAGSPVPFRTWEQFWEFLTSQVNKGNLSRDEAELIYTNANPNDRINKFCPPKALQPGYVQGTTFSIGIDKTDLIYSTTEFCFSSMGQFHIECRGTLEDGNGVEIATAKVAVEVKIFDILKLNSQQDFESYKAASLGIISAPESVSVMSGKPPVSIGWLQLEPLVPRGIKNSGNPSLKFNLPCTQNLTPESGSNADRKGTKDDTKSILNGGDLSADGILCWRERERELYYTPTTSWLSAQKGAVEFWMKLPAPPDKGSDEVIFYNTTKDGTGNISWRLERYGPELLSTRFYWGGKSPYAKVWTLVVANLNDWKANEWHHIAITWGDAGGTPLDQELFIDGKAATIKFDLPSKEKGLTATVGGVLQWGSGGGTVNVGTYTIQLTPDKENIFKLVSNAANRFDVMIGGYTFDAGSGGELHGAKVTLNGTVRRFINGVLDDIEIYDSPNSFPKAGFQPPSRYEATTASPATYELKLPLPDNAYIGQIGWTVYYPDSYKNTTIYQRGVKQPVKVNMKYKLVSSGAWQTITLNTGANAFEGEFYPIKSSLSGNSLSIQVEMTGSTMDPLNVTPILDDLSIVYMTIPQTTNFQWIE